MTYDVTIIGGGVVGLSILHASLLAGYDNVVLFERNADLCDGASGRNSGILCTGVDAPSGSLERALIRDSISRMRGFCEDHNVPTRACGSLVCLWPWDEDRPAQLRATEGSHGTVLPGLGVNLESVLRESHIAGDGDAALLSSDEVAVLEPSISSKCRGAVHIPGETVVDPWLFTIALAAHCRELAKNSGREDDVIRTGIEVVMESSTFDTEGGGMWSVTTRTTVSSTVDADEDKDTARIAARCVINASGIDSDLVQLLASSANGDTHILPQPKFQARPRRGQYAVFAPTRSEEMAVNNCEWQKGEHGTTIPVRPIQPVPSQFTKGIFVYSTLYDQIVVGPTAQCQSSRIDDMPDPNVTKALTAHVSRILGQDHFDDFKLVGEFVGIRPGTDKRDYQIHLHHRANFITVGGIRSTGLTASLGISRHVVQCLLPTIISPRVDESSPSTLTHRLRSLTPLPNADELVKQYHTRGDGTIIVGGYVYKVTHPLTKMGWDARTGLAAMKTKTNSGNL